MFNDAEAFEHVLRQFGNEIAALIIEPTGKLVPEEGYLAQMRQLCDDHGVILF